MKSKLFAGLLAAAVVCFSNLGYAEVINDRIMKVFLKIMPEYMKIASQYKVNAGGYSNFQKSQEFRDKIESLLSPYYFKLESIAELAAKINIIYANLKMKQSMGKINGSIAGKLPAQLNQPSVFSEYQYTPEEENVVKNYISVLDSLYKNQF